MAKQNNGAPGIDGVTFEAIEESGFEAFLLDIQGELTYRDVPTYAESEKGNTQRATEKYVFWEYRQSGTE